MKLKSRDGSLSVEVVELHVVGNGRCAYVENSPRRDGEYLMVTDSRGYLIGYYSQVKDLPEPLREPGLRMEH